jgi:Flp pilus assembly protein TadD
LPLPPPVAVLPPQPKVETEVVTSAPTVDNDDDGPRPPEALAAARKALEAGDHDRALKYAKVAILRLPKRSGAWNTLGRIQLKMGKRKDAITSFEQAVELNPSNSYARNNLGLALIYDKRYDEAVDALEEAVTLEPVEGYMWNNLGMAYEQVDRLEEARESYSKAVEMNNDRARESLARLLGVKSVIKTAKVDTDTKTSTTQ